MIRNLVLSGGSVRTVSSVGCLKYLHDHGLLKDVSTVVGTSAGAILGFMLALGHTPSKIADLLKDVMVGKGYNRITFDDLLELNVLQSFGLDSGANITAFLQDILEASIGRRDVTFIEFAKRVGKNFVVCVANLSAQKTEYMCVDTSPHASVVSAVRMSASIPILFAPVRHTNGDLYVDGGLYETLPIGYIAEAFSSDMLRDTLAIRTTIKDACDGGGSLGTDFPDLPSYLSALVGGLVSKVNETAISIGLGKTERKIRVFELNCGQVAGADPFCFDMDNLNFSIDDARIDAAVDHGYAEMSAYLGRLHADEVDETGHGPGAVVDGALVGLGVL
jgi:predicted acylesterase/phospholipase RssA